MSLKAKIIVINIITLLIAVSISTTFSYLNAKKILLGGVEETLTALAVSSSKEVGLWLDGRKSEVSTMANTPMMASGSG